MSSTTKALLTVLPDVDVYRARNASEFAPAIEKLRPRFDVIVADTPPNMNDSAQALVMVSDLILIPTPPSADDVDGTKQGIKLVEHINRSREELGRRPADFFVILNKRQAGVNQSLAMEADLHLLGYPAKTALGHRVAFSEVRAMGTVVTRLAREKRAPLG